MKNFFLKQKFLQSKPELKFILNKEGFELFDISDQKNNGIYLFSRIKNVELNKKKMNWVITVLSYIVEIIANIGGGHESKEEANLILEMTDRIVKISLRDAYFNRAEKLVELIKN